MRTFLIVAASAILLGAVIVELSTRLWPGSAIALLILASLTLLFQGYLSLRLAKPVAAATVDASQPGRSRVAERRSGGDRESGTVKWFNRTKGFGFIVRESGEEIFVHQRSIRATNGNDGKRRPSLKDGQKVTFTVANREKGLQAEDVAPA